MEEISLRFLRLSDATDLANAVSKEVTLYNTLPWPYTKRHALKFIRETIRRRKMRKKRSYDFGIFHRFDRKIIGMCSLSKIDYNNKNAEVGLWLDKNYWNRGLGKKALQKIVNFGFRKLKLVRLYAKVVDKNKRSIWLMKNFGFKMEGTERKAFYKNGRWYNLYIYGLLRDEGRWK